MRIRWKMVGSFEEFYEGDVICTLFWPDIINGSMSKDVRAYMVKNDNGNITIVPVSMIVSIEE